ncbi:hypothetical protein [Pseudodonghicola xiamenensis]|uniref:Antitoxin ParD n=1 Tax=Pseudodonghicola xiamenensis TaxID=337702 RepID=A0A8J3MED7_9RHOB|nr:hypothetical protein [Pseudodonghicola xiamenensis]GHH05116.1 hypothetical protein GCM10010961_43880 [Pseudodonghicola xiamenensis]
MPRLSIDITPEEHQKLKAIAALRGQSIKDYVLNRTLGDAPPLEGKSEEAAFDALARFIEPRIEQARRREFSSKSISDIKREAREQAGK